MAIGWGIDVGVGSIGLAVLELDDDGEPQRLIDGQARIFKAATGGAERRGHRSSRTQYQRRSARLARLRACLSRLLNLTTEIDDAPADRKITVEQRGVKGDGAPLADWVSQTDRVQLRALGLEEKLSREDLARAILHLARNRGLRLTRSLKKKEKNSERKDKKKAAEASRDTSDELKRLGSELGLDRPATPGQLLYHHRLAGSPTRLRKDRPDAPLFTRTQVAHELSLLLKSQASHHSELTPEAILEIEAEFAWEQEPPDPLVGACRYGIKDPNDPKLIERRLARATDLAETKRIYEALNNVRLRDRSTAKALTLSLSQRDVLAEKALAGQTITAAGLRKALKLGGGATAPLSSLEEAKGRKGRKFPTEIVGHRFAKEFLRVFGDSEALNPWKNADAKQREAMASILGGDDIEMVEAQLVGEFNISPENAALLADGDELPSGYTAAGQTATKALLLKLQADVISLHEAERLCEFDSVDGLEPQGDDPLPYYGKLFPSSCVGGTGHPADPAEVQYGRIPNPVVHLALNQLRKLAKSMRKRHGAPDRIHIELARDLNKSAEEREAIDTQIAYNRKNNIAWVKSLMAKGGRPSRAALRAMKLHFLQGGKCLYSGDTITVDDIVTGSAQVDHILPRKDTMDDSLGNLALCKTAMNKIKSKRTPFEAFSGGAAGRAYAQILKDVEGSRKHILPRFEEGALEKFKGDGDIPSRFLSDTRYIAKIAHRYLSYLLKPVEGKDKQWREVVCVSGQLTAKMRHEWGLTDVIKTIMIEEGRLDPALFDQSDDADKEADRRAKIGKIRWDHRHHLLDAIVVGCITRRDVQRINTLLGGDKLREIPDLASVSSLPWGDSFRSKVLEFLRFKGPLGEKTQPVTRVTLKPEHETMDRLHAETNYGIICAVPGKPGQYVATSYQELKNTQSGDLRQKMVLPDTVLAAIDAATANGSISEHAWGGNSPEQALRELKKSRRRLIDTFDAALEAQSTHDADGKTIAQSTRIEKACDSVRMETGQRRFRQFEIKSLVSLKGPLFEGARPIRMVALSANDRLVYWQTKDDVPQEKVEIVSTFDANNPEFSETWEREAGTLIFRARQGDILELLEDIEDPIAARKLYCLGSISGEGGRLDIELKPIDESRPAIEVRKTLGGIRIRSVGKFSKMRPRLVVLDVDGRVSWLSKDRN